MIRIYCFLLLALATACGERKNHRPAPASCHPYATKNIIIVVVDGPRYSETWGDPSHTYIPHMAKDLAPEGAVFTNFRNTGPTYTNSGHTTITTGFRQEINNTGREYPRYPSLFQYFLKASGQNQTAAWIITTKDKLEILSNTADPDWKDKYRPATDCGVNGLGTGYREDSTTLNTALEILKREHPRVVLINFKEPDASAHAGDWQGYLKGIRDTDEYVWKLWNFVKTDTFYKDKTAFFVTNDHGRHLDGVKDGFVNHGDSCEGCRHINLYAYGPDFIRNKLIQENFAQQDITATCASFLHLKMDHSEGTIIRPLLKKGISDKTEGK